MKIPRRWFFAGGGYKRVGPFDRQIDCYDAAKQLQAMRAAEGGPFPGGTYPADLHVWRETQEEAVARVTTRGDAPAASLDGQEEL